MEKIVRRDHQVKLNAFGFQKYHIVSYPDTYTGYIYSRLSKSQIWFECLWDTLSYNLTKFLDWSMGGIRDFLQIVLAAIFFLISIVLIMVFTVAPQLLLKLYWRLLGYPYRMARVLLSSRDVNYQLDVEGREDQIAEIREIVKKRHLISPADRGSLANSSSMVQVCNIAEEILQTGKAGAELTQDLRKLLRLVDILFSKPNSETS